MHETLLASFSRRHACDQVLGTQAGAQASRRQRAALKGISQLLAALEAVMAPSAYLGALLALLRHPQESMTRRALRLLQVRRLISACQSNLPPALPALLP